jgi:exodeoxyribonuclease-3
MNIISYNVNGIRAAIKKGLVDWLAQSNIDVLCLQENKAQQTDVDETEILKLGYDSYWFSALKKGYSGVTIYSKIKPQKVILGNGYPQSDQEGRVIQLEFEKFILLNCYFPSGTSGDERQAYKYVWLDEFYDFAKKLDKEKPLVICGDSNGFIDSFRFKNPETNGAYSWWSQRFPSVRLQNKGWRIDYICVSDKLKANIKNAGILPHVKHSDHCPVWVELDV